MPLPRLRVGPASGCLKEGPELWGPPTGGGSLRLKGRSRPEPPEEEQETALAPGAPARGTSRGGDAEGVWGHRDGPQRAKGWGAGVCVVVPVGFALLQLEPATQSTPSPGTPAFTRLLAGSILPQDLSLLPWPGGTSWQSSQDWLGWGMGESIQDPRLGAVGWDKGGPLVPG